VSEFQGASKRFEDRIPELSIVPRVLPKDTLLTNLAKGLNVREVKRFVSC